MLQALVVRCSFCFFLCCAILLIGSAAFAQHPKVLAPHLPVAPRLPHHHEWDKPAVARSLTGGLWMIDGNTKATAYLSNMLKYDSLTVTPVLHLGNGKAYRLAPVTLEPSGTATIDINQAVASQGIAPYATLSGYFEVQYKWGWEAICGDVWNVDVAHSLIFVYSMASPPNPAAQPAQGVGANSPPRQTVEGAWWKQDANVTAFVALSNLATRTIPATIQVFDGANHEIGRHTVVLSPGGTKIVNLNELLSTSATAGGVFITYEGAQNELVVNAGAEDPSVGYSARLPLGVPPDASAKIAESSRAELGLMVGPSDPMMNFPSGVVFTPYTIARNLSEQALSVTPELWWMEGGGAQSATLPRFTLAPHQTQRLDMPALLAAAGLATFSGNVNLVLDTDGPEGAPILAAGSVDKTNTYVFEVVPRGVSESASKGLSYWNTTNGNDTMVTLWNPADEDQDLVFTLFYTGGHYAFPIHLAARATRTFNVSEITHNPVPDAEGNVVPAGTYEGSAEIAGSQGENQEIVVAVDSGIYNVRKATCGNYYCVTCNGLVQSWISLNPFSVAVGGSTQETFAYQYNTGTQYDATSYGNWSSSNTGIFTVNNGLANGIGVGTANISAYYPSSVPVFSVPCQWNAPPSCPPAYTSPSASGGGNVLQLSLSPGILNVSSGDTNVTIGLTIAPSSASVSVAFNSGLSSNPNSSSPASVTVTNPSGNVSGSYNAPVTVSGTNSPSGKFNIQAVANGVTSNVTDLTVPPQILIQMIQQEAGGTNPTTMTAVAEVVRNRFSSSMFDPPYSTYQNAIPGQFQTSSTLNGVQPELDIASSVFTGTSAGNFCGSLAFWTPTTSQWSTVQNALNSGTTTFPSGVGAPVFNSSVWPTSQQQILYVSAVGTQGNGAPNFLFLAQRTSSQSAAVSVSCN